MNLWRSLRSSVASLDPNREMDYVRRCMDMLGMYEKRLQCAGRLCDLLNSIISVGQLPPLPLHRPSKRSRDSAKLDLSPIDRQEQEGTDLPSRQQQQRVRIRMSSPEVGRSQSHSQSHSARPESTLKPSHAPGAGAGLRDRIDLTPAALSGDHPMPSAHPQHPAREQQTLLPQLYINPNPNLNSSNITSSSSSLLWDPGTGNGSEPVPALGGVGPPVSDNQTPTQSRLGELGAGDVVGVGRLDRGGALDAEMDAGKGLDEASHGHDQLRHPEFSLRQLNQEEKTDSSGGGGAVGFGPFGGTELFPPLATGSVDIDMNVPLWSTFPGAADPSYGYGFGEIEGGVGEMYVLPLYFPAGFRHESFFTDFAFLLSVQLDGEQANRSRCSSFRLGLGFVHGSGRYSAADCTDADVR
ncbi:hypothetical protein GYMLUDRAFT_614489 [Collybiopsis luxurians FD-317 M1]|uniref:Uncharacterized protein n=1 Tax=Collybiopsis luxurians FD-317 M1 TaxID=944289 RepID=A0A0D0CCF1_9AGAR|nr:hypothetical protein GYMLUDRAFT_614489 [Collybiopsis luxurians FD-317 M1]